MLGWVPGLPSRTDYKGWVVYRSLGSWGLVLLDFTSTKSWFLYISIRDTLINSIHGELYTHRKLAETVQFQAWGSNNMQWLLFLFPTIVVIFAKCLPFYFFHSSQHVISLSFVYWLGPSWLAKTRPISPFRPPGIGWSRLVNKHPRRASIYFLDCSTLATINQPPTSVILHGHLSLYIWMKTTI